jgi:dienelactone hydrolase
LKDAREKLMYLNYPLLVIQGEKDALIDHNEVLKIFKRMNTNDKTIKLIAGGYHELYADREKKQISSMMVDWITDHLEYGKNLGPTARIKLKVKGKPIKKGLFSYSNILIFSAYFSIIKM